MMTTRVSDFLRYYLVFSPTELALPVDEFLALLNTRLAEAKKHLLTEFIGA